MAVVKKTAEKQPRIVELSYAEFLEDWDRGLIREVQGTADKLFGKSVKGQAGNPRGYILVYCVVPAGRLKKPWYKFW